MKKDFTKRHAQRILKAVFKNVVHNLWTYEKYIKYLKQR